MNAPEKSPETFTFTGKRRDAELVLKAIGRLDGDDAAKLESLRRQTQDYLNSLDLDKTAMETVGAIAVFLFQKSRSIWGATLQMRQVLATIKKAIADGRESGVAWGLMTQEPNTRISVRTILLAFCDTEKRRVVLGTKKSYTSPNADSKVLQFWPGISFPIQVATTMSDLYAWADQDSDDRIKFDLDTAKRIIELYEVDNGVDLSQVMDRQPTDQELEDGGNAGFTVTYTRRGGNVVPVK